MGIEPRSFAIVLATLLAVAFSAAAGEPVAVPDGAELYTTRTCVACHGKDARTPILPTYPKLAGQNEAYLLQQMKDIKSGVRVNTQTPAMQGVMHLVDDADMAVLAEYISKLVPMSEHEPMLESESSSRATD